MERPLIFLAMSRAVVKPLIKRETSSGMVPEPRAMRRRHGARSWRLPREVSQLR
jgi:hypothetical protein